MLTREGQRDTKLRPTANGQEGAPSLALGALRVGGKALLQSGGVFWSGEGPSLPGSPTVS